jgi:hypothetical protein
LWQVALRLETWSGLFVVAVRVYEIQGDAMSFLNVLEEIGKDFEKGLKWAVEYAVPVEKLAALLFPQAAPAVNAIVDATTLIQNAVLLVEQKYVASGAQAGTGAQKLAEVMVLAGTAVTSLLQQAGILATSDYIENLISAVVGVLNVQAMPVAQATSAAAAEA